MIHNEKDNNICRRHNCFRCCVETEMILSKEDIDKIIKNYSVSINEFSFISESGYRLLKNKKGKKDFVCYFLNNEGLCNIYENRPEGCIFYPIIWDLQKHKPIKDHYCPYNKDFHFLSHNQLLKFKNFIFRILGEI